MSVDVLSCRYNPSLHWTRVRYKVDRIDTAIRIALLCGCTGETFGGEAFMRYTHYPQPMNTHKRAARLIIVCGLPGSGKTTLAKLLESRHGAFRMEPDEWMDELGINLHDEEKRARIEALQWRISKRLLALGQVVIIEWGTWGRSERDALRLGARSLGADVELHYLAASPDVLHERITRRGQEDPPISIKSVRQWCDNFQVPTSEERALFDDVLMGDDDLNASPKEF